MSHFIDPPLLRIWEEKELTQLQLVREDKRTQDSQFQSQYAVHILPRLNLAETF